MPSINLAAMMTDPFPTFAALRAELRWTYEPAMDMWLVSRHADVVYVDEHPEIFSAQVPGALLTRTIGVTMLRLDGDEHRRARGAGDEPFKRRSVQRNWQQLIDQLVAKHLDPLRGAGAADLVADFATPFTGDCLREVLGLPDAAPADIGRWSDAYIAGLINNSDDPEVWAQAKLAADEAYDHVAAAVERTRAEPDATVISAMANGTGPDALSVEEIAANVRLMISGGFNDARDAVATLPWFLLTYPDVRARVKTDPAAFELSIDELVRWLSPVGSYPRVLVEDLHAPMADLSAGDKVLVIAASANWDDSVFAEPQNFDIDRSNLDQHLGFSVGAHYCLGSHLVRAMVRAAVPAILALPEIEPSATPEFVGWQFRGPVSVPVRYRVA